MLRRIQQWPQAIVEEVGAAVAHWRAVKDGALEAFWPAAPQRVARYIDEMLTAQMLTARMLAAPMLSRDMVRTTRKR